MTPSLTHAIINSSSVHLSTRPSAHQLIPSVCLATKEAQVSPERLTRGVRQEAAGVELQLLHEVDLSVVTQAVEVTIAQDEDGG